MEGARDQAEPGVRTALYLGEGRISRDAILEEADIHEIIKESVHTVSKQLPFRTF